jgi:FAD-linked sulfhydryl oxidase
MHNPKIHLFVNACQLEIVWQSATRVTTWNVHDIRMEIAWQFALHFSPSLGKGRQGHLVIQTSTPKLIHGRTFFWKAPLLPLLSTPICNLFTRPSSLIPAAITTTTTTTMPEPTPTSTQTQPQRTTKETHPNLPPGLILGPDGKPCKVCNSFGDWAKIKVKKVPGTGSGAASGTAKASAASAAAVAATTTAASASSSSRDNCPPDSAALGRATWTFLHTTAAYYPLKATPEHQSRMRALLGSLPQLYPCTWCADDFGADMKASPPDVSGREALSRWLCERHNVVNAKLGKEKFDCAWAKIDARWKDGPKDGSCD